jgi:uncharacterized protein (UPF0276 family)
MPTLGEGIGWRPELALAIDRRPTLGFIEVIAEDFFDAPLPLAIEELRRRGIQVVPHGIGLSLGSAEPPDPRRLRKLADLARRCDAPLVSEHLCFVRAGGRESGHLLPIPRTREMLEIVVENIRQAQAALPVPLALENISTHFDWPGAEFDEPDFLRAVLETADVGLLLDLENVHTNAVNHGLDPIAYLDRLPLERLAYVHVAGGIARPGAYHDTHTRPVPAETLDLLRELAARVSIPGVLLERDGDFPSPDELYAELDTLTAIARTGATGRPSG